MERRLVSLCLLGLVEFCVRFMRCDLNRMVPNAMFFDGCLVGILWSNISYKGTSSALGGVSSSSENFLYLLSPSALI